MTSKESLREFPQDFLARYWSKVEKTDACWVWKGTKTARGYGVIGLKQKQYKAHKVAVILSGRSYPDKAVTDHLCRNTSCVNPAHLEVVTNAENVLRGISFGAINKAKTHCLHGHPFSEYGVFTSRKNGCKWRYCKECMRVQQGIRKRRARELIKKHG